MDFQTQNNIRGMRLPDLSQDESGDDLVFDPALERKRVADGTEEYLTELRRDWAKQNTGKNAFPEGVSKISSALRGWMLSYDRTKFYNQLAEEFHLQGADRIGVARVAWDIVLKSEWSLSVDLFRKYIGNVSVIPELVNRFSGEFIPQVQKLASVPDATSREIASDIPEYGAVEEKKSIHAELSLMKALGKFEKLGSQQVTNSKIMVKGQNDPVRPTIFNWLRAYRDELGVGAHDAVVRGQFLFHSLNGKGLSPDERDQVGMLLKSLDENMPLTIDAERQEVVFREQRTGNREQGTGNKEQGAGGREQGARNKEQGVGGREQGTARIAVTPLAGGVSAVRGQNIENSGLTAPKAERPMFANTGNISRAVFDLPHVSQQITRNREQGIVNKQQITNNREQGTGNGEQRTGSKEQGAGSREQEIKNSGLRQPADQERLPASGGERPMFVPPSTRGNEQVSPVPAPRTVSFEPAKIDNFSFGAGRGSDLQGIENSGLTAPKAERPMFANEGNVSAVSFSTNHVMPAEKEGISEQGAGNREQEIPNTIRQLTDQIPNAERPLPIPTAGASIKNETTAQPAPVKQAPTPPPVNRFRITPTGHRDTVASDDTPSPHVVDLRS